MAFTVGNLKAGVYFPVQLCVWVCVEFLVIIQLVRALTPSHYRDDEMEYHFHPNTMNELLSRAWRDSFEN